MKHLLPTSYFLFPERAGFTIIELLVTIAIIAVISGVVMANLFGARRATELDAPTKQIVSLLREAQSHSISQSSSTSWGVCFVNAGGAVPFYTLFSRVTSTERGHYPLPAHVSYDPATVPAMSERCVSFAQITGLASASTSVRLLLAGSTASSTIRVASSGVVTY